MDERVTGDTPDAVHRLAGQAADPYLLPHHVEAACRLARLFQRANMMQRVTMSYDPQRVGGGKQRPRQAELAGSAADARRMLNSLARRMPSDCWGVLTDVCGFDKGLQTTEAERQWPRRSAKLVLRIGLDQIADLFGLLPHAQGGESGRVSGWIEKRLPMFPDGAVNDK